VETNPVLPDLGQAQPSGTVGTEVDTNPPGLDLHIAGDRMPMEDDSPAGIGLVATKEGVAHPERMIIFPTGSAAPVHRGDLDRRRPTRDPSVRKEPSALEASGRGGAETGERTPSGLGERIEIHSGEGGNAAVHQPLVDVLSPVQDIESHLLVAARQQQGLTGLRSKGVCCQEAAKAIGTTIDVIAEMDDERGPVDASLGKDLCLEVPVNGMKEVEASMNVADDQERTVGGSWGVLPSRDGDLDCHGGQGS